MQPQQFYKMRLKDFFLKVHFYNKKEERQSREKAELIRMQTFILVNIQLESKNKLKVPADLWRFPWDTEREQTEIQTISPEKQQKIIKKLFE